ncbi:MAG: carboxylating nicotinate-nucleotide diphosphorylase [Candidatus Brocadiia bacterium]
MDWAQFDDLISAAVEEDHCRDDITTNSLVPKSATATASFVCKEDGVICGLDLARRLCNIYDAELVLEKYQEDGDLVNAGTSVCGLTGKARAILQLERTVLNFLQRLSGVATLTRRYVDAIEGTGAKILDTRKTTPGWRHLHKYAVRCGGGTNHRMGLHDMVLIKDNHIRMRCDETSSGIRNNLGDIVRDLKSMIDDLPVEVEVENLQELREVLEAEPDYILLDNMSPEQFEKARQIVNEICKVDKRPLLEASGAITLATAGSYAEAGADRISVGELTHSAPALDISANIVTQTP